MAEVVKQAAEGASTDPKNLSDESDDTEEPSFISRDLFWDKVILFLSTAIVALTAVDILTELLQGSDGVVCFVPEELNATDSQDSFIQNFCSQTVPDAQYLPIFVLIHGILIGAAHYVWKSSFGNHFNYFFSLTKSLARLKDETTGAYPFQNIVIIKKLQVEFSAYNRKKVFRWYQLKLFSQALIAVGSVLVSFLFFGDNFQVQFRCPRDNTDPELVAIWPYPDVTIDCIFSSLRLFSLVRIVDVCLLLLLLLFLIYGFLWTIGRHAKELNAKKAALFTFTTGVDSNYFVPKSIFRGFLSVFFRERCCSSRLWQEIKERLFVPRISTDLDFFLMLLYRTDSSLGHAFTEGQIFIEHKSLLELDQLLLYSRDVFDQAADKDKDKKIKAQVQSISTRWTIGPSIKPKFRAISTDEANLSVPDNIRGMVMGLSLRISQNAEIRANDIAIDVSFGSRGFSNALARSFYTVGSVNFDPAYQDGEEPVKQTTFASSIMHFQCYDDIFTRSRSEITKFREITGMLWEKDNKKLVRKINYMVIGPIVELRHVGTVKKLLDEWKKRFGSGSVLVILEPHKIEGTSGKKQFYHLIPPEWFEQFNPGVVPTSQAVEWPVTDGNIPTPNRPPRTSHEQFSLRCGDTFCEFKIRCYRFKGLKKAGAPGGEKGREGGPGKGAEVGGAKGGSASGAEGRVGGAGVAEVGGTLEGGMAEPQVVVEGKGVGGGEEAVGMGLLKVENDDGDKKGLLTSPV